MGTRRRRVSVKSNRSKLDKWDDLRMQVFNNPTPNEIKMAAKALKDGNLVAFPTETVYGLGADATNEKAVGRIYSSKGRPLDHPLIVHISSIDLMNEWAIDIPAYASKLAEEFWPGPLTLILKRSYFAKDFITGGQDNVGLRVPAHPVAMALLKRFDEIGGLGVAAPSANRFGAVSPTTVAAVSEELAYYLGLDDLILNGDQCQVGIESTIIDCTKNNPIILRPGAITYKMVKSTISIDVTFNQSGKIVKTSGLLDSHYSPRAKVLLNKEAVPGDGLLAMDNVLTPIGVIRLASPKTIEQYAMVLYEAFRSGDQKGLKRIIVIPPEGDGIAVGIRDRLLKASAG
jgi:L-threonylcarbamoyladenylate synthase